MIRMIQSQISGALLALAAAQAQVVPPPIPNVVSHGTGIVEVAPDRVELLVRIESRAARAAQATEQTARLAQAVLDTLRLGFRLGAQDLTTLGLSVRQEMSYPGDGRPPLVTGYVASNTLRVRTAETASVGRILDATVAKGATAVVGPTYFLADSSEHRRQALTRAVAEARRDAAAMALAAGGALGDLLEITSEPFEQARFPMPRMAAAQSIGADVETPVEASDLRISAIVVAKWRFVRPGR